MTDEGGKDAGKAGWSKPEKWAWTRIRAGRVADFSGECAPRGRGSAAQGVEDRTLGAAFLRAILFEAALCSQIPIEGLRIRGARWTETLELPYANGKWPLVLENCTFEAPVDLSGLRLDGPLSLRGSTFRGSSKTPSLRLDRAAIGHADCTKSVFRGGFSAVAAVFRGVLTVEDAKVQGLFNLERAKSDCIICRHSTLGPVILSNAEVEQDVVFAGAQVKGVLKMPTIRIRQDLSLGGTTRRRARFEKDIDLTGASIGQDLVAIGAIVNGSLRMNGTEVRKHLFLRAAQPGDRASGRTVFRGDVDLSFAQVHGHLELTGARFLGTLNLRGIFVEEDLSAWKYKRFATRFEGPVDASSARVKGGVDMSEAVFAQVADFSAARIDGDLNLNGTNFRDKLLGGGMHVGRQFWFHHAERVSARCKELDLLNAKLDGLAVIGILCTGPASLSGVQAGNHLFIRSSQVGKRWRRPVFNAPVDLSFANVTGIVDLNGTGFRDGLDMESAHVGQDLRIGARIRGNFSLRSADVGGSLTFKTLAAHRVDMSNLHVGRDARLEGRFESLDLSGATISGRLCLDVPAYRENEEGQQRAAILLDLRDVKAGSLQIPGNKRVPWPANGSVQLDGFTYDRLGGSGTEQDQEMIDRDPAWFKKWLALDLPYSPQPYEHLAGVLRQAGQAEKANRILFYGRERARDAPWELPSLWPWPVMNKAAAQDGGADALRRRLKWFAAANLVFARRLAWEVKVLPRWWGLSLLRWSIGYGIGTRYFLALLWALVLTFVGVWMLGPEPVGDGTKVILASWQDKAAYSFDQLLPIVELSKEFGNVKLSKPLELFFHGYKLLGFLFGTFIAAGVAGLTQRSKS